MVSRIMLFTAIVILGLAPAATQASEAYRLSESIAIEKAVDAHAVHNSRWCRIDKLVRQMPKYESLPLSLQSTYDLHTLLCIRGLAKRNETFLRQLLPLTRGKTRVKVLDVLAQNDLVLTDFDRTISHGRAVLAKCVALEAELIHLEGELARLKSQPRRYPRY